MRDSSTVLSVALSLSLASAAGCSSCEEDGVAAEGEVVSAAEADAECAARVATYRQRLEVADGVSRDNGRARYELPRVDGGALIVQAAAVVETDGQELWLDGRRIEDADALREDLETLHRSWSILHPDEGPFELQIRAAAEGPAQMLLPIVEHAAALGPVALVIVGAETPDPLPFDDTPEDVRDQVATVRGMDDAVRAHGIRQMIGVSVDGCEAVTTAVHDTINSPHGVAVVPELVAGAILSCGCEGVDVDRIEAALLLNALHPARDYRALALTAEALADAPDTVEELARALVAPPPR